MYNMQAVVRKNINNATMQFEKLGYVANNLANYSTPAYKISSFEQILREDGYVDGAIRTNTMQGSIRISKNPYDVAISGEGYIPVVSADGEVQYTRDGSFKVDSNGQLVTNNGLRVMPEIILPEGYDVSTLTVTQTMVDIFHQKHMKLTQDLTYAHLFQYR